MTTTTTAAAGGRGERPGSRADRARRPRARDVLRETAVEFGVCVRPLPMRRINPTTGEIDIVDLPCGSTRAAVCPSCAAKARKLRAQQCREGWHLPEDPDLTPRPATKSQRDLVTERAHITDAVAGRRGPGRRPDRAGVPGVRAKPSTTSSPPPASGAGSTPTPSPPGAVDPSPAGHPGPAPPTRRRRRPSAGRSPTSGPGRRSGRPCSSPSPCPSYGPVRRDDSMPVDPTTYDYVRAARDALHFGKLLDRWCQNLRRVAGYDVQYFAVVEPQKRAAPHAHFAIRGTLPRAVVKQLTAATYAQVWWPTTDTPVYTDTAPPRGTRPLNDGAGGFVDPDTRQPLPTWEEALDALEPGPDDVVDAAPSPGTSSGSASRSTSRASWPAHPRPNGASATSSSTWSRTSATTSTPNRHTDDPDDQDDQDDERPVPADARPPLPAAPTTSPASSRRCAGSRARRPARTGCATASNPRTPARPCGRAAAAPRPTSPPTSATAAAASSSPASGPPRTSPTTATTAAPTSSPSSAATPTAEPREFGNRDAGDRQRPGGAVGAGQADRPRRPTPVPPAAPLHRPRHPMARRVPHRPRSDRRGNQLTAEPAKGECGMSSSNVVEHVLYTPEEAAEALRLGRSKVYDLMRTGALRSVKIGGSRRIPVAALRLFVDSLGDDD